MLADNFWEKKKLSEFTVDEWEALCDGCGECCYRKFISKHKGKKILYYTSIACDLLDLESGLCSNYKKRFTLTNDCSKISKKNIKDCYWLPETCAYRLLYEGKPLYPWHPLISKDPLSVKRAKSLEKKGIHEKDVIDWFDFVVDKVKL